MDSTDGDCNDDGEGKLAAIEVERIAYAAIGRHLRVMCFLCLLLLVLGFLIGHHVANQHTRELARDLEQRGDGLSEQLTLLTGEIGSLRQAAVESERRSAELRAQVVRNELAAKELKEGVESADSLRRSLVVQAIEQAEADRRGLLREFKPYVDRNQALSAEVVSHAFTRVIDAQRERLNRLIDVPTRTACAHESASMLPLVPVSESGPSPTFSGSAGSSVPETPIAAVTDIFLFETAADGNAPAPAPAPPPPVETPINPVQMFAPPVGLTPVPAGPSISLGPTVPPIAAAPPEAVGSTSVTATPQETAPLATVESTQATTQANTPTNIPAADPVAVPEVRKNRSALFFTPSRKPPSSSIPAIPIGSAPSAPTILPPPYPTLRTAGQN